MTIKKLLLDYTPLNSQGTFSAGDTLSGRLTVEAAKDTSVQHFLVKVKGKAEVNWSEQENQCPVEYTNTKKYFSLEQIILQDRRRGDGSEIIGAGKRVFPFTFHIPQTNMPSSYEGKWGRIAYSISAKLTQTMWTVYKIKKEFPFISKSDLPVIIPGLKEPQHGTTMSFLGCGNVTMNVTSERMGFIQGESFDVQVEVHNNSTHALTPEIYLYEKQTFLTQTKGKVHTNQIKLGEGDLVPASTSSSVSRVLTIPPQLHPTIFNCSLIKLEYRLKIILEVPLNRNQEILLPFVLFLNEAKPLEVQKKKKSKWSK